MNRDLLSNLHDSLDNAISAYKACVPEGNESEMTRQAMSFIGEAISKAHTIVLMVGALDSLGGPVETVETVETPEQLPEGSDENMEADFLRYLETL